MRYFDKKLVTNSRPHRAWWAEVNANRSWFHNQESQLAAAIELRRLSCRATRGSRWTISRDE